MNTADLIWLNGEFVAWEDAKVHVLTHALHYGTGVFEGIRAYETDRRAPRSSATRTTWSGSRRSAKLYYMDLPYTKEQLREVTHELIVRNGFKSCYIRPLVYRGYGPMGLNPLENPVEAMIAVWEWGAYLGEEGKRNGVRARVSSYRRISSDSLIPHSKASGQYLNSVLAKIESVKAGYEEAILLDDNGQRLRGHRREHLRHQGRRDPHAAARPRRSSTGINRKSCIQIARDLGYEVVERDIARAELALADEVFLTGTAAELTPMREIDDIEIGPPGPITREIQGVFEDALQRPRRPLRGLARPRAGAVAGVTRSSSTTRRCAMACRARACRSRSTRRCASRTRSTTSAFT